MPRPRYRLHSLPIAACNRLRSTCLHPAEMTAASAFAPLRARAGLACSAAEARRGRPALVEIAYRSSMPLPAVDAVAFIGGLNLIAALIFNSAPVLIGISAPARRPTGPA